ncbi:hypothetical protein ACPCHT_36390 [Nucisporomicrobium flavum]|uniref:hypothetical protein n=1 Tax=Nucisporomicrobium flavum TaxID=2785915 RepID=UPI003C2E892E
MRKATRFMRRKPSLFLTLLTAATALAATVAAPAQAAPAQAAPSAQVAVKMTFNATPEPALKGSTVTLTGRVWVGATGNRGRVSFYFRKAGTASTAFTYRGYATTTDAGTFTRRYVADTTGTWKAVFAATTARKNAARLDAVQVVQRRSKLISDWQGTSSTWQSPTLRVPTKDYKVIANYTCEEDGFLFVAWNGNPSGYESANASTSAGTVTLNGHAGARTGYFDVSTWINCSWRVRVFSGIENVQV